MWLIAAFYYAEKFSKVTTFVEALDNDAVCVEQLKSVIKVAELEQLFEGEQSTVVGGSG